MTPHIERRAAREPARKDGAGPRTLVDLMYEGFYALFLLKNGCGPHDKTGFVDHITQFLDDVDRRAKQLSVPPEDVEAAKYAYCAAVDEIILRSQYDIRDAWETRPLQLRLFGDQLAGEHFFQKLEELRARGIVHLQSLEVFHLCLLLGFQGKYALDAPDKLNYLCSRLGDEIARMRGKNRGFAPHADRPDQIANKLRTDLSLWVLTSVFALAGLGAYLGFNAMLGRDTDKTLAAYNDLVKLPPRAANVTITLP
ncbi:DotU family type IV/VI secretion system protein [Massilia sp. RP-1-19]|uniref:DotU family type IV/VI secretion system protein n=1 Tax=Massilia polaris TaxID=2728846 RepID=A0A848HKQ9_9BURK|nr:type IVB secretion system protein IcmH/DotU [Massilia polaris]NML61975.1 DotU family type IV/VI secretion system protein [Massilia polaris]